MTKLNVIIYSCESALRRCPMHRSGRRAFNYLLAHMSLNVFFQYLGLWYENRNYFAIFQAKQECVTATYSLDETNDDVITVLNEGVK